MTDTKKNSRNSSLSVKKWLDIAESELCKNGISAVRVELLAKKLKVTKGSFYWHFDDRQDLFNQLISRWQKRSTNAIIDRLDQKDMSYKDRLKAVFLLPHNKTGRINGGALEAAIRNWSQSDDSVKQALKVVDKKRLLYITDLYKNLGNDEQTAENKAYRFYYTLQGMAAIKSAKSDQHIEDMFDMLL